MDRGHDHDTGATRPALHQGVTTAQSEPAPSSDFDVPPPRCAGRRRSKEDDSDDHPFPRDVANLDEPSKSRVGSTTEKETIVDEGEPISYLALATDTPVLGASGSEIGKVAHVLQIPELDEFDGIVVSTKAGHRFIHREQITEITTTLVRCDLSDEQAASLPAPSGPPVLHLDATYDEGPSLNARFARLFRRPHWKELE